MGPNPHLWQISSSDISFESDFFFTPEGVSWSRKNHGLHDDSRAPFLDDFASSGSLSQTGAGIFVTKTTFGQDQCCPTVTYHSFPGPAKFKVCFSRPLLESDFMDFREFRTPLSVFWLSPHKPDKFLPCAAPVLGPL